MLSNDQVKLIQKGGVDWLGAALTVDGMYGPRTQFWHYVASLCPMRQDIVRQNLRFHAMGVKDDGHNRGELVDKFVAPSGLAPGVPWCIAMQSHVLTDVGADWPVYHMSAFKLLEWAKENNRLTDRPLPGDLHCFLYPKGHALYGSGHGGCVIMPGTSWMAVCDGNVSDAVTVGMRAREGLSFIRTVEDDVQQLSVSSMGLTRLDGWKDR